MNQPRVFNLDLNRKPNLDSFQKNLTELKAHKICQENKSLDNANENIFKFVILQNHNAYYKNIQSKKDAINYIKNLDSSIEPMLMFLKEKIAKTSEIQNSLESIRRLTERFKNRLINGNGFENNLNYVDDAYILGIQEKFREYLSNRIRDDILTGIIPAIYVGIKDTQFSQDYIDYLNLLNDFLFKIGIFTPSKEEIKHETIFNYDIYMPRLVTDNSLHTNNITLNEKIKDIYSLPYFFGEKNYIVHSGEATAWRYCKIN